MRVLPRIASMADWVARHLDKDRVHAATTPHSADIPENDRYWRKLGAARTIRDITPAQQKAAQDDSARGFQKFSLQRRATGIYRGFCVGAGGVRPKVARDAKNADSAQRHLDTFWNDADNRIEDRVGEWSNDLSTYGELCLVAGTGESSKRTKVGLLDVGRVECVISDPEDAGRLLGVVVVLDSTRMTRRVHPIIRIDGTLPREFAGQPVGAVVKIPSDTVGGAYDAVIGQPCVWARINALASQCRGIPDSYPALDALALRDRSQFSFMERLSIAFSFVWKLLVPATKKPKDVDAITKQVAQSVASGTGQVVGLTNNMELTAEAPQSGATDYASALRIPMADILNAFALPEHWFSGGPDMSNASAGEVGSPSWTALQERQRVLRCVLKTLGTYALAQIPEVGKAAAEVEWDVTLPVIVGKDAVREITVLQQELGALDQLKSFGLSSEAVQREAQKCANDYGATISDDEWEDPEPVGLRFPGPITAPRDDPQRDAGARVDPQGNPSDSKPQENKGAMGAGARAA